MLVMRPMSAVSSTAANPAPTATITARALIQTSRWRTAAAPGPTLVPSSIVPSGATDASGGSGSLTSGALVAPGHDAAADRLELNRLRRGRVERRHGDVLGHHHRPRRIDELERELERRALGRVEVHHAAGERHALIRRR